MAFTGKGLVEFVKTKIGVPYVYGMKGTVMTLDKYNQLKKLYGSYVWDSDINKVGKVCCDCSGLISWYTGIQLGSSQYKSNAKECNPISTLKQAPVGALVWQSGHIGVYIGTENGELMYIAEDGSAYGCRKNKISNAKFTHWLLMPNFTYEYSTNSTEVLNASASNYLKGVTTDNLNMRKYANTNCDILGTAAKGSTINIVNKYTDGWYTVNYNSAVAYASSDYININTTAENVKTSVNILAAYGCITTKEYWYNNYANLKYLDSLLINMALAVKKKASANNIKDFPTAVNTLVSKGCIATKEYWLANVNKVQYLQGLIINVANALM